MNIIISITIIYKMSLNDFLNRKRNYAVVDDEKIREQYLDNLFNQARVFKSNVTPKEQKTDEILTDIFNNISKLANEIDANILEFSEIENINLQLDVKNEELDEKPDNEDIFNEISSLKGSIDEIIKNMDSLGVIPYYYNLISNKFNLNLRNKLDKRQIDTFNERMDYVLNLLLNYSDLLEANPLIETRFKDRKILDDMIREIQSRDYKEIRFKRNVKLAEYARNMMSMSGAPSESVMTGIQRARDIEEEAGRQAEGMTPEQMQELFRQSRGSAPRAPSVAGTEEMADFAGWTPQDIRRLRGEGKKKGLPESEMIDIQNFKKNVVQNKKKMINLYDDRKNNPYID